MSCIREYCIRVEVELSEARQAVGMDGDGGAPLELEAQHDRGKGMATMNVCKKRPNRRWR